jgi:hypothetical protein
MQNDENDDNNTNNRERKHRERKAKPRLSVSKDCSDIFIPMNTPITLPSNINYEKHIVRVINPNRKLRRNKTAGSSENE